MNIKGQGHPLTLVQGHLDSIFSNFFSLETSGLIEAKFYVEPPSDERNERLYKWSRPKARFMRMSLQSGIIDGNWLRGSVGYACFPNYFGRRLFPDVCG